MWWRGRLSFVSWREVFLQGRSCPLQSTGDRSRGGLEDQGRLGGLEAEHVPQTRGSLTGREKLKGGNKSREKWPRGVRSGLRDRGLGRRSDREGSQDTARGRALRSHGPAPVDWSTPGGNP